MRCALVILLVLLAAGCSSPEGPPPGADAAPILVTDARSGLVAVSAVGARNVRVLLVRGPSIVRLREIFVADGERVMSVHWADHATALIVDTDVARLAFDPATGRVARLGPPARGVATRATAGPRG